MNKLIIPFFLLIIGCVNTSNENKTAFPFTLPEEMPERELSSAVKRLYTDYSSVHPQENELFSQFKYTELKGFDYNNHDGTITRRDPSKVIYENGKS